ncbi:MAG: hypothetical protein LUP92_03405 [Methanomicrobiales archaeon]|nr:hypothetical protein [Methanomicrobiales archaeon]MDD1662295.1 hypothetical protein [Methanomicrobiales archaeon]
MNEETEKGGTMPPVTGPAGGSEGSPKSGSQSDTKNLFIQGLYAILFLFILIAALQLYFSIQEFIRLWFSEEFIPIANSIYYILVIVGGLYLTLSYIKSR